MLSTIRRNPHLLLVSLLLVAAWLIPAAAQADDSATTCTEGTQPGGALYRICVPDPWNGELLVYAHGYVAPNQPSPCPPTRSPPAPTPSPGSAMRMPRRATGATGWPSCRPWKIWWSWWTCS